MPEKAAGGIDDVFDAQRSAGISVWYCRKRGVIGWAVMTGSCEWVEEPVAGVVEMAQRGRSRDSTRDRTILEAIFAYSEWSRFK